jgi:hypothetical protein
VAINLDGKVRFCLGADSLLRSPFDSGLFDLYKADQEKDPGERYMHSFDFLPGRSPPSAVITTFENILLECVQYVRSLD